MSGGALANRNAAQRLMSAGFARDAARDARKAAHDRAAKMKDAADRAHEAELARIESELTSTAAALESELARDFHATMAPLASAWRDNPSRAMALAIQAACADANARAEAELGEPLRMTALVIALADAMGARCRLDAGTSRAPLTLASKLLGATPAACETMLRDLEAAIEADSNPPPESFWDAMRGAMSASGFYRRRDAYDRAERERAAARPRAPMPNAHIL